MKLDIPSYLFTNSLQSDIEPGLIGDTGLPESVLNSEDSSEHDINKVSKELDMDIIKIPHNNKSSETFKVDDVYCDESISIINEWYKKDFEELDYIQW